MSGRALARLGAVALLAAAAAGCTRSYKDDTTKARTAFYSGQFDEAARRYCKRARRGGKNRLLYLLDAGMSLRAAQRYEESNRYLIAADELAEELNVNSVAEAAASVIFDDRSLTYRGEEFELVLVNTFLAMNFLEMGGPRAAENALVECRRLDWKLRELSELRKRKYLQNAFSRYISGVAYEMDREPNEAYIDYQAVHKLRPDFEPVKGDLVRLAAQLGFRDHLEEWEKKFGFKHDPAALRGTGEVVLVLESGRSPEKVPMNEDDLLDLPDYASFPPAAAGADLLSGGRVLGRTQVLEDIDATARRTLSDRMKGAVARRVGKTVMSTGLAVGARKVVRESTRGNMGSAESRALADLAGLIVFVLLTKGDQADTRSWLTLPANLQVVRARLPAGTHTVQLRLVGRDGSPRGHIIEFQDVTVREGRITLLSTRTLR